MSFTEKSFPRWYIGLQRFPIIILIIIIIIIIIVIININFMMSFGNNLPLESFHNIHSNTDFRTLLLVKIPWHSFALHSFPFPIHQCSAFHSLPFYSNPLHFIALHKLLQIFCIFYHNYANVNNSWHSDCTPTDFFNEPPVRPTDTSSGDRKTFTNHTFFLPSFTRRQFLPICHFNYLRYDRILCIHKCCM